MDTAALSIALAAGALATLNPCAFPLLPAFLSLYVAADEATLPAAVNRIGQGVLVGVLVTAGFLVLFATVALPITYGASAVADAVPWAGMLMGGALTLLGAGTLLGRTISLPLPRRPGIENRRRLVSVFLFGCAYAITSLGCTLPVFLAVIGASVSADGPAASLVVLGAYGVGIAIVLIALSVAAALMRSGLGRRLRSATRRADRMAGALLTVSGLYLTYYWVRLQFGPSATLADDPLIGPATRYTARLAGLAQEHAAMVLTIVAIVVVGAIGAVLHGYSQRRHSTQPR